MSRCRDCDAEIVWVEKREGGFHPPFERMDQRVDDETYGLLHSGSVVVMEDGEPIRVRASTLYVQHQCQRKAARPAPARPTFTPEQLRWQEERRQKQERARFLSEHGVSIADDAWREGYYGAEQVECPKCRAGVNEPCHDLRSGFKHRLNQTPHDARFEYALGSGHIQDSGSHTGIDSVHQLVRSRDERKQMHDWLAVNGALLTGLVP